MFGSIVLPPIPLIDAVLVVTIRRWFRVVMAFPPVESPLLTGRSIGEYAVSHTVLDLEIISLFGTIDRGRVLSARTYEGSGVVATLSSVESPLLTGRTIGKIASTIFEFVPLVNAIIGGRVRHPYD